MTRNRIMLRAFLPGVLAVILAGIVVPATLSGDATAQAGVRAGSGGTIGPGSGRVEPCWKVAGISRAMLQERRSVEQQSRQEVQTVCANSSLSASQKRQQIAQIHQREHERIDGLISPAQQESLKSCQEQRHGSSHGGHMGGGHGGPCGEMPTGKKPAAPAPGEDEEPEEAPKPN